MDLTTSLPAEFLHRMEEMLQEDFPVFLESYQHSRTYGLRVNTSKLSCDEFEQIVPFPVKRIPWISNGYFYSEDIRPSRCPMYPAGLYYLQEPSAMTPASRLPVNPGERVLDLCAAPGGKATALGSALRGKGLLVANDISASRAKILLRNMELFGISNALITSEPPARLVPRFPAFFDKILLDAPCSGEGMFRKEEALALDWSPEKSHELSLIQKQLIENAADMLRPGGLLLYSTCTFSPEEDEEVIAHLLHIRPDMELIPMEGYEGFSSGRLGLADCVRIFPHKMAGEGHFLALLHKKGGKPTDSVPLSFDSFRSLPGEARTSSRSKKQKAASGTAVDAFTWIRSFFDEIGLQTLGGLPLDWNRVELRKDKVYYLPPVSCDVRGLNFLRSGLYLGDLKKDRFEPSQPFALALHKGDASGIISLSAEDERLQRYLRGETISIAPEEAPRQKGWHLLAVEGYPLGFGKLVNQTFKNKYPAGWRIQGG